VKLKLQVFAVMAVLGAAAPAWAQEFEEGGKLFAIQNRKYVMGHEFTLGVGVVPDDAFYKGFTGTFAYTYHFSDLWAWEIVSGSYSFNIDTDLRKSLEMNFGAQPTKFPELTFFGDTNLQWKPLYGKAVFMNDTLLYAEIYLTGGPALSRYENTNGVFVGADLGVGLRLYLSKTFAIRLEARDYYFLSPTNLSDTQNVLFFQLGLGLNIR
jgi:outer membrane beta-barrel protein